MAAWLLSSVRQVPARLTGGIRMSTVGAAPPTDAERQ